MFQRRGFPWAMLAGFAIATMMVWTGGLIWYADELPGAAPADDTTTDAIVVLTGGSDRLETGLSLLTEGLAERLFVTGVADGVQLADLLAAAGPAARALDSAARARIELGHEAEDTAGNALETRDWAAKSTVRSIRLVTSAYHMPRAMLEFRRAMPDTRLTTHPVFPESVRQTEWWQWRGTTLLIAGEYTKYLAAAARAILAGDGRVLKRTAP